MTIQNQLSVYGGYVGLRSSSLAELGTVKAYCEEHGIEYSEGRAGEIFRASVGSGRNNVNSNCVFVIDGVSSFDSVSGAIDALEKRLS